MNRRILVIRFGSLGDIVLTSPAVMNLKIAFPDSHITFACKEDFRSVAVLIPGVDEVVTIRSGLSGAGYFAWLMRLDRRNFDLIVDLHGNMRSWLARKVLTAEMKSVYPKRRLERIMAVKNKLFPSHRTHTIDMYNQAVTEVGGEPYCKRPLIKLTGAVPADHARGFVGTDTPVVVIAPGAAHRNKQYPPERFCEIARQLHEIESARILWTVTSEDASGPDPSSSLPEEAFLKLVDCPVDRLAEVISRSAVTVANDSGVMHLSSAVGTPVVAIFGPTHPVLGFAPAGLYDRISQVDEYCRPCSLHGEKPCYRSERFCFTRIPPELVVGECLELIRGARARSRGAFIDRDGTLIKEKHFLSRPEEAEFETGSIDALRQLAEHGFKLVIVSNQSGVARGMFDTDTVERVNGHIVELLAAEHVFVDAVYYCPHHPEGTVSEYAVRCDCRKPGTAMVDDAAYQLNLSLRDSVVFGDKLDDINLATASGGQAELVRTGYGLKTEAQLAGIDLYKDVHVSDNFGDAVKRFLGGPGL